MEGLPDDLLCKVMKYLPMESILACACVSRRWNYCARQPEVWEGAFNSNLLRENPAHEPAAMVQLARTSYFSVHAITRLPSVVPTTYHAHISIVNVCEALQPHLNPMSSGFRTRFLATGAADNIVRIWDISGKFCLAELVAHTNAITQVFWMSSRILVSCGWDKRVCIWDLQNLLSIAEPCEPNPPITMDIIPSNVLESVSSHCNFHSRAVLCLHAAPISTANSRNQHAVENMIVATGGGDGTFIAFIPSQNFHAIASTADREAGDNGINGRGIVRNSGSLATIQMIPGSQVLDVTRVPTSELIYESDMRVRVIGFLAVSMNAAGALIRVKVLESDTPSIVSIEIVQLFVLCDFSADRFLSVSLHRDQFFAITHDRRHCEAVAGKINWTQVTPLLMDSLPVVISNGYETIPLPFVQFDVIPQPKPHIRRISAMKGSGTGLAIGMIASEMTHLGCGTSTPFRLMCHSSPLLTSQTPQSLPLNIDSLQTVWPRVSAIGASPDVIAVGCIDGTVQVYDFHATRPFAVPLRPREPSRRFSNQVSGRFSIVPSLQLVAAVTVVSISVLIAFCCQYRNTLLSRIDGLF